MSTRKVRYKKLNTKTPLPVLREDQIDPNEYESLTNESQIATGVEQAEENVSYHYFSHLSYACHVIFHVTSRWLLHPILILDRISHIDRINHLPAYIHTHLP